MPLYMKRSITASWGGEFLVIFPNARHQRRAATKPEVGRTASARAPAYIPLFGRNVSSLAFCENEVLPGGDGRQQLTQFRNRWDSSSLLVARVGVEGLRTQFPCDLSKGQSGLGPLASEKESRESRFI